MHSTRKHRQGGVEHFAYFMIRVHHPPDGADGESVSGLVEHLKTGEKRSFESSDDLVRLIIGWPGPPRKMKPEPEIGNG